MKTILSLLMLICMCACDSESEDFIYKEYELPAKAGALDLNIEADKAVLINDKVEFQRVFSNFPNAKAVDFKNYTLLLVKGVSTSGIRSIEKTILKTDNKYMFAIHVYKNIAAVMEPWCLAYIIPKTSEENITLSVTYELL
ncbi:hypothetical protein [Bacteroides graminisolvens]|uniref:hypothetical protein n=1 Tax=Bacteroides graminisolvens TaxID=477666 RepID=UPI0029C7BC47|nr:hypothetical protein [Bacteroides graminisolvens]